MTAPTPRVLLLAVQRPELELSRIQQVLHSQGYQPQPMPDGGEQRPAWLFTTADGRDEVRLYLILELGVLRFLATGPQAESLTTLFRQALPSLDPQLLTDRLASTSHPLEQRVFVTMLILTHATAAEAMDALGQELMDRGPDEVREGVVQGLALLESPDAMRHLRAIQKAHADTALADLAGRALQALASLGLEDEDPEHLLEQAENTLDDNPEEALELLERAELAGLKAPRLHLVRARALRHLERFEEAVQSASRATSHRALIGDAALEQARAFEALGRSEDAAAAAQRAVDAGIEAASAILARLRLNQAPAADASGRLAQLSEAIDQYPNDAQLREQRAPLLIEAQRYTDALSDLEVVLAAQPDHPRALVYQAEALLGAKHLLKALKTASALDFEAAPKLLRHALTLKPRVYFALDQHERARTTLASHERRYPDFPELRFARALALEALDRTDEAQALYTEVLEEAPAQELVGRIQPVLYNAPEAWNALSDTPISATPRPDRVSGADTLDSFFKTCLSCGTMALARRSTCKQCSGRDFLEA